MSNNSASAKVALPYAEALFESSKVMELVDKTCEDLKTILKIIEKSSALSSFLANPLVATEAKKNVLRNLFVNQVSDHVLNFLSILVERRRITILNSIINSYLSLVYKLQQVTVAKVYAAIPLTEIQQQSLKEKLKRITKSQEVQLIFNINTELIGGFVVEMGSKVIDMSIYGQLNKMSSYLNGKRL